MDSSFSAGKLLKDSWKIFKKRWADIYKLILISAIIMFGTSFILEQLTKSTPADASKSTQQFMVFVLILGNIVSGIINNILSIGWLRSMLKIVRSHNISASDFRVTIMTYFKYIVVNIMVVLIVIVGLLLLIVPGIIWSIKFTYASNLVIDRNLGIMESLKASSAMTKGVKGQLLILSFVLVLVILAGLLAFGVGLLVAIPVTGIAQYLVYNSLLPRLSTSPAQKKKHKRV